MPSSAVALPIASALALVSPSEGGSKFTELGAEAITFGVRLNPASERVLRTRCDDAAAAPRSAELVGSFTWSPTLPGCYALVAVAFAVFTAALTRRDPAGMLDLSATSPTSLLTASPMEAALFVARLVMLCLARP